LLLHCADVALREDFEILLVVTHDQNMGARLAKNLRDKQPELPVAQHQAFLIGHDVNLFEHLVGGSEWLREDRDVGGSAKTATSSATLAGTVWRFEIGTFTYSAKLPSASRIPMTRREGQWR